MRGFFDFDGARRASVTREDESQSEGSARCDEDNIRHETFSPPFWRRRSETSEDEWQVLCTIAKR